VTTVEPEGRRLLIAEEHALVHDGRERVSDYQFVMRCWTHPEIGALLAQHGFTDVQFFGAYDPAVRAGATDRLVVVARSAES
jgi:hypothetical protein